MPINTTEPGVYRATFPLHYPDADAAGFVRLTSLLNLLQIQAGENTESLGFDYRANKNAGIFWVLSRLTLKFDSWPEYPCRLTVDTWARGNRAVFALRDYRFGDEEAGWAGRGSSAWVLLKDRKPQRPEAWIAIYERVRPEEPLAEMPAALPALETEEGDDQGQAVQADWEDVDMNGHVNNVNAVGWCLAQHDFEFLSRWRPEFLEVNFLAEMFCGQKFSICRRELPGPGDRRAFDYVVLRETDRTPTLRLRISFR
jgi:acyl-ACP thioesterase